MNVLTFWVKERIINFYYICVPLLKEFKQWAFKKKQTKIPISLGTMKYFLKIPSADIFLIS